MVKLGNPKNAIWEALLITIIIFVIGLLLGATYESNRFDEINEYYVNSEIFLMDAISLNNLNNVKGVSCETLIQSNLDYADRIYWEALLLDKYEDAGKLTEDIWLAHKKYDALRTFVWINTLSISEKCKSDFSTVVYLYKYEEEGIEDRAKKKVWSKILSDLKEEKGDEILLISMAVDSDLTSLNSIIEDHNVVSYPVVIINNKDILYEVTSIEDFEKYL